MSTDGDIVPERHEYLGSYCQGVIQLAAAVDWPDGTPVTVRVADVQPARLRERLGRIIVAGFGLAGRWITSIFDRHGVEHVVIEINPETVETQRKLGRDIIQGDVSSPDTLRRAGIQEASILALTIPDEQSVIEATRVARELKPDIYIIARTNHTSAGMRCSQSGADDVIKAEQVVAREFYEMLLRRIGSAYPLAGCAERAANGPSEDSIETTRE